MFFVISGFVITRGVLLEIDEQRFSLQAFYLPRARRILPALIVTLFGTLLVGCIIISPFETREFARSALANLVSAANVFFPDRINYFADAAHYRPLLHTWSLSLEEQFYLLLPLRLGLVVVRAGQAPSAHPGVSCGPVARLLRGGGDVPHTPCLLYAARPSRACRCWVPRWTMTAKAYARPVTAARPEQSSMPRAGKPRPHRGPEPDAGRARPHTQHIVLVGPVPELEDHAPATLVRALRGLCEL